MRTRMGALENQAEQTWTSHQGLLLNEIIVSQASHWKAREEVCSLKQRQNLKGVWAKARTSAGISAVCSMPRVRCSTMGPSPAGCE